MKKCIFLDRDGVINKDKVDYVYKLNDLVILDGVADALQILKKAGYLLIVITNQSGIAKGTYTHQDFWTVMDEIQHRTNNALDAIYYSPYHESSSSSLARKPGSLMFEKAISKFDVDIKNSWMVGDRDRDLIPAKKLGLRTILITGNYDEFESDYKTDNLLSAAKFIIQKSK